jgi:trk system potassium uptake protein TrkH
MLARLHNLPLLVILMAIGALAMYLPAAHALVLRDHDIGRPFFYSGTLFLFLAALLGLASAANAPGHPARNQLLSLLAAFTLLPLMLAIPFNEAVPDTGLFNSWWEMVSSMTTTGGTLYAPERLAPSLHLWRATVGWLGGFLMLVVAIALLAPLRLGGFEVFSAAATGSSPMLSAARAGGIADSSERMGYFVLRLAPAYLGLTLALWIGLLLAGDPAFVALCHAMSVLSTSGISPLGGVDGAPSGVMGEALIFLFFLPALSRRLWPGGGELRASDRISNDPELRLAAALVLLVTVLLVLRHWIATLEVSAGARPEAAFSAFWGVLFTALSFLTTTGFESGAWAEARQWSGLSTSGLVLAGFAIVGGGVATTAGGVRLLRVYALLRHGERELQKMIYPRAVLGGGAVERHLRRDGAYIAWVFFMLFALSIAVGMAALSLAGLDFEPATILTIAALSNTGPLADLAADQPLAWAALDAGTKFILALTMVLGRLETLAIVALFNPEFWRN